eukprot:COSAG01_NODE_8060_length_2936_cov_1.305957_2_plen_252_part_00
MSVIQGHVCAYMSVRPRAESEEEIRGGCRQTPLPAPAHREGGGAQTGGWRVSEWGAVWPSAGQGGWQPPPAASHGMASHRISHRIASYLTRAWCGRCSGSSRRRRCCCPGPARSGPSTRCHAPASPPGSRAGRRCAAQTTRPTQPDSAPGRVSRVRARAQKKRGGRVMAGAVATQNRLSVEHCRREGRACHGRHGHREGPGVLGGAGGGGGACQDWLTVRLVSAMRHQQCLPLPAGPHCPARCVENHVPFI